MIPKLAFGKTGHLSTRTLFGGAALWDVVQSDADRILDLLLEKGVNHIDTAASYGDSELRIGPWMKKHRKDFFLATKTEKRTYQEAKEELHKSLERLQTDHVDLWQMHFLVDEEGWQTAMGAGGALDAFIEAREQGLVNYLGVTGHGLQVVDFHKRSLERFDFDSILLPYYPILMQNRIYAAGFDELANLCKERNLAVQTIKSLARGLWKDKEKTHTTWYEPYEEQTQIDAIVHWVLSRPDVFLNTTGDIDILPMVLDAADRFDMNRKQADFDEQVKTLPGETIFE
ncbi:MAG: aldo/keto reductase [Anaerolineaceae bacterium]|nr:aldo/keto reductase [Anaerolineaceae bacterium]